MFLSPLTRSWRFWTLACIALGCCVGQALAEPRIALVIGNGGYSSITRLPNAVNDAKLIATTLSGLGFRVTQLTDADQAGMKTAIAEFGRALRSSGPDTVGLFYYAGHGVQSSGVNYLLPVNSAIHDEADLDLVGVEGRWVVRQMESARNQTNIVILDACRNNPFAAIGATTQGLARMDAPTGTFIAYSTAPGNVAMDGRGTNSPFTAALANAMARPGVPVEQMFKDVRINVLRETSGAQTPWDSSSLVREFVFKPAVAPTATSRESSEDRVWASVRVSNDAAQVLGFLQSYPKSMHTDEAQSLLKTLGKGGSSAGAPQAVALAPGAPAKFTAPFAVGAPEIDGKSMEQLIHGTPAYPPIDGLPAEVWQGKQCATCHQREWTQKTLCDQGLFYIKSGETRTLSVKHPFGNAFGTALRGWAASGCP